MPEVRVSHGGKDGEVRVVSVAGDDGIWMSFAIPEEAAGRVAEALLAKPEPEGDADGDE